MKTSNRGLKICLAVFFIFLILLTTVIVTLIFTVFKPKDPEITVTPLGLDKIQPSFSLNATNVTLNVAITIVNRNYGSFRYENSTGYVNYGDVVLAEVPMETENIPARSTVNVTTTADFMVGKLITDPKFLIDVADGSFDLTSMATLPGKVTMLKIFKMKATVHNTCDMSVNVTSRAFDTKCRSKIKM